MLEIHIFSHSLFTPIFIFQQRLISFNHWLFWSHVYGFLLNWHWNKNRKPHAKIPKERNKKKKLKASSKRTYKAMRGFLIVCYLFVWDFLLSFVALPHLCGPLIILIKLHSAKGHSCPIPAAMPLSMAVFDARYRNKIAKKESINNFFSLPGHCLLKCMIHTAIKFLTVSKWNKIKTKQKPKIKKN